MSTSYPYGTASLPDESTKVIPFEDFIEPVRKMKESILWQLKELENTAQFPFVETIICSKHFEAFNCLITSEQFDEQLVLPAFQTLVTSSGYYNAFLGKPADEIFVTIHLIDLVTTELYETIQYPAM